MSPRIPLPSWRLVTLPVSAKLLLSAFLLLIGSGYLVAVRNIFEHHQEADLKPGLTLDDLRRVYHGLETEVAVEKPGSRPSIIQHMIRPGGAMRPYLEAGGADAVATLTAWLEAGAPEKGFAQALPHRPGAPSPQEVIARQCVRCHNAANGERADVPYARDAASPPEFALVAKKALPPTGTPVQDKQKTFLPPTGRAELVQITHAHILTMPVFTLAIAGLFLGTGLRPTLKAVLLPVPMLAMCADFAGWWLSRDFEVFVYLVGVAGGLFGAALGLQILCVCGALWFGRRPT